MAARVPILQRGCGRRGRELRIERQQNHHPVRAKLFDRPGRRAVTERMPATHGDKRFRLHIVNPTIPDVSQGPELVSAGLRQDWRTATNMIRRKSSRATGARRRAISFANGSSAQFPAQLDDRGIQGKQVSQKGLDRFRAVRATQIEENNRQSSPPQPSHNKILSISNDVDVVCHVICGRFGGPPKAGKQTQGLSVRGTRQTVPKCYPCHL